jgi:hypothetical protein
MHNCGGQEEGGIETIEEGGENWSDGRRKIRWSRKEKEEEDEDVLSEEEIKE